MLVQDSWKRAKDPGLLSEDDVVFRHEETVKIGDRNCSRRWYLADNLQILPWIQVVIKIVSNVETCSTYEQFS